MLTHIWRIVIASLRSNPILFYWFSLDSLVPTNDKFCKTLIFCVFWIASQTRNDVSAYRHCEGVSPKQSREMQHIKARCFVTDNKPCHFLLFEDYNECLVMREENIAVAIMTKYNSHNTTKVPTVTSW